MLQAHYADIVIVCLTIYFMHNIKHAASLMCMYIHVFKLQTMSVTYQYYMYDIVQEEYMAGL